MSSCFLHDIIPPPPLFANEKGVTFRTGSYHSVSECPGGISMLGPGYLPAVKSTPKLYSPVCEEYQNVWFLVLEFALLSIQPPLNLYQ